MESRLRAGGHPTPLWHARNTEVSNRRAQMFSLAHVVKITRVGKKARIRRSHLF
jgi:hypothetical protein